ncbi:MAG: CHASE2 domain-containing protein [Bacteroidota bacterium]
MSSRIQHGLLITAIIFGLIGLVKLVTFRSHYFDPFNNGMKDYEVTDIVFSQLRDPERIQRETRVVLVHVAEPQREEMAEILTKISRHAPAVVGVDILFPGRKDSTGDARLSESLAGIPNLVLAANLAPYVDSLGGIPNMIVSDSLFSRKGQNAYTNFLAGADRTVRLFTPRLETLDGQEQSAFAVALAQAFDPEANRRLLRRNKSAERINYLGDYRSYLRMDGRAILDLPEEALALFRDRIVMVGFVDSRLPDAPLEDRYFTPLNPVYTGRSIPDMYGMVIHANIVSMILDGHFIYTVPEWLTLVLSILFGFINVIIIHRIYHWLPDTFHGVTRILQLVELLIFFFLVAFLFHFFSLKIDFSIGFLALILAYDVVMIYESFIRKRLPYFKNLRYE